MKKLLVILFIFITSISYGQLSANKLLTTSDPTLDFVCLKELVEISVYDDGAADTIYVYMPMPSDGSTTVYALIGKIMDLTAGEEVTLLAGSSDNKIYQLWFPYPRAVRITLSSYASGDVYVRMTSK